MRKIPLPFRYTWRIRMREIFNELAAGYLPWWRTDEENKDIGLKIAEIFINQMEENKREYNQARDKIHVSFTKLLGISLMPPKPAEALVQLELVNNTTDGIWIGKGTKLYGISKDAEKIIFETVRRLYATGSRVKNIFAEIGEKGKIRPVIGEFPMPFIIDGDEDIYKREEAVIYHSYIFAGDNQVFIIKTDNERLINSIETKALGIYYFSKEGIVPAENLKAVGGQLLFEMKKQREREDAIIIRKKGILEGPVETGGMLLSSITPRLKPDFVRNHIMDCDAESFYPLGDTFGLHDECLISQDLCFSKVNSLITMEFFLDYEKIPVGLNIDKEQRLPLVKRYKKYERKENINEVWADRVIFEYNSREGWKRLNIENHNKNAENIFAGENQGNKEIRFYCPKNWGNEEEGRRLLKIRIIEANHCYEQPCIFNTPVISGMRLSYSYDNSLCTPEGITTVCGMNVKSFNNIQDGKKDIILFNGDNSKNEEIYVCFDKKIMDRPVSLYIQCGRQPVDTESMEFFYYTKGGFKRLTTDASRSGQMGILIFDTPDDMEKLDYCGVEGYYIKIIHNNEAYTGKQWSVIPNVLEVWNVDTGIEEDYYADEIKPGMSVKLYGNDIYKIDLWMDETRDYLAGNGQSVMNVSESRIRIERNEKGEAERVLVLWREVNSFQEKTGDERIYVLDREHKNVVFGDGIRQKLPTETEKPAFKAAIYSCDGERGNVGKGEISEAVSNILFSDKLYNIEPAFGGSGRETIAQNLKRAEVLMGNHGRLVTADDYYREVMNFSRLINKASVRVKNGRIYIVILTEDFSKKNSGGSFEQIYMELKNHLLKMSEAAMDTKDIVIVRPLPVEISVGLWFEKKQGTDMLSVSQSFYEIMEEYLHPVKGNGGNGWPIGKLPYMSQILMQLNTLREWGVIKKISATARYEQQGRIKECELDMIKADFYMAAVSGNHEIHTAVKGYKD